VGFSRAGSARSVCNVATGPDGTMQLGRWSQKPEEAGADSTHGSR
jgi:hypothetical protein